VTPAEAAEIVEYGGERINLTELAKLDKETADFIRSRVEQDHEFVDYGGERINLTKLAQVDKETADFIRQRVADQQSATDRPATKPEATKPASTQRDQELEKIQELLKQMQRDRGAPSR
jgi:DNA polymerase III delta prime subunit